jgi:integrase
MKHQNRGLGFVFQPTYRDKRTGEQKTSAVWWISYSVRGKRHKESSESTNRADAVRLLKKRHGDAQAGKPVGSQVERTTLDDLISMVEADYAANARRSAERIPYAAAHLREYFGGTIKACEITSDRITAYLAHRLDAKAARATANYEQALLNRGFRLASRAGRVAMVPHISMLKTDNVRQGFFEKAQLDAVLRHLPEHLRPLVTAGYLTGWRRGELLSRLWRHVDLKDGWLRLEVGETKNGRGRAFPINAMPELRELLLVQFERKTAIEKKIGQIVSLVFFNPDGSAISDFRKAWRSACRAAGCPGRLFHDFRRTAVRNLERSGVSRSASMALTGHLTAAVFARYSIVDSAVLEEAVEKYASAMSVQKSQSSVKVSTIPVKRARKNPRFFKG